MHEDSPPARSRPRYQIEPDDEFRATIWAAGAITPLQLFRIAAWKSAKGMAPLSLNTEESIAKVTSAALQSIARLRELDVLTAAVDWEEWELVASTAIGSSRRGTGLLGLDGVGYAMATAILAVLAPGAFPVMDRWTTLAIFGEGLGRRWERAAIYSVFSQRLRDVRPAFAEGISSIHELDQAVMNAMIGCTHRRSECDHVKFDAIALP